MSNLKPIIDDLITRAMKAKGSGLAFTTTLARGLQITVKHDGQYLTFGISRMGVMPSMQEWEICKRYLPDWMELPDQLERTVNGARHWLYVKIDTEEYLYDNETMLDNISWKASEPSK